MDKMSSTILLDWLDTLGANKPIDGARLKLADIGCYNVNGSVRSVILQEGGDRYSHMEIVGFDVNVNHTDDIAIGDGFIPEKFHHKFDFITCLGTLNYGNNNKIMEEIKSLCKKNTKILINVDAFKTKGGPAELGGHSYTKKCDVFGEKGFKEFIKHWPGFNTINMIKGINRWKKLEYLFFELVYPICKSCIKGG